MIKTYTNFFVYLLIIFIFIFRANAVTISKIKDITQYGDKEDQLLVPYGAFFDTAHQKFYITDCLGEKYIIYDKEGSYLETVHLEKISRKDAFINYFKKLDKDYRIIKKIFQFDYNAESLPSDITISKNKIYVVEENNERIVVYDKQGNFLDKYGKYGNDKYKYKHPLGVFINDEEEIFVVDSDNNRLVKYDSDFNYISEKGNKNITDLRLILNGPYYGDYNDKKIFITDRYNNRVLAMNDNFEYEFEIKNLNYPHDITFDEFDNIFVTDTNNSRITIYDKFGKKIGQFEEGLYNPKVILYLGGNKLIIGDIGNQDFVLSLYNVNY